MHAGDLKIIADDSILIFDFFSSILSQADELEVTEHDLYLATPSFFKGVALTQLYSAVRTESGSSRSVRDWPTAVQFLLRCYMTNAYTQEALKDLIKIALCIYESEE